MERNPATDNYIDSQMSTHYVQFLQDEGWETPKPYQLSRIPISRTLNLSAVGEWLAARGRGLRNRWGRLDKKDDENKGSFVDRVSNIPILGVLAGAFFEFIGNIVRFIITWVADIVEWFFTIPLNRIRRFFGVYTKRILPPLIHAARLLPRYLILLGFIAALLGGAVGIESALAHAQISALPTFLPSSGLLGIPGALLNEAVHLLSGRATDLLTVTGGRLAAGGLGYISQHWMLLGGMAVSRWLITRFVFSRPIRNKYVNILGYAAHFAWVALFIWQGGMVALGIAVEWWHMSRFMFIGQGKLRASPRTVINEKGVAERTSGWRSFRGGSALLFKVFRNVMALAWLTAGLLFLSMPVGSASVGFLIFKLMLAGVSFAEAFSLGIQRHSLWGLSAFYHFKPTIGKGRFRVKLLWALQQTGFFGLGITFIKSSANWWIGHHMVLRLFNIEMGLAGYLLGTFLLLGGLWVLWTWVFSTLFPTRGPGSSKLVRGLSWLYYQAPRDGFWGGFIRAYRAVLNIRLKTVYVVGGLILALAGLWHGIAALFATLGVAGIAIVGGGQGKGIREVLAQAYKRLPGGEAKLFQPVLKVLDTYDQIDNGLRLEDKPEADAYIVSQHAGQEPVSNIALRRANEIWAQIKWDNAPEKKRKKMGKRPGITPLRREKDNIIPETETYINDLLSMLDKNEPEAKTQFEALRQFHRQAISRYGTTIPKDLRAFILGPVRNWLDSLHEVEFQHTQNHEGHIPGMSLWDLTQLYDARVQNRPWSFYYLDPKVKEILSLALEVKLLYTRREARPNWAVGASICQTAHEVSQNPDLQPRWKVVLNSNQFNNQDDDTGDPSSPHKDDMLRHQAYLAELASYIANPQIPIVEPEFRETCGENGEVLYDTLFTHGYAVTLNRNYSTLKSGSMNGLELIVPDARKVRVVHVLDRDAVAEKPRQLMKDFRRSLAVPNLVIMVGARKNSNPFQTLVTWMNLMIEGGHENQLKGQNDFVGTGWQNLQGIFTWYQYAAKSYPPSEMPRKVHSRSGQGKVARKLIDAAFYGVSGAKYNAAEKSEDLALVMEHVNAVIEIGGVPVAALTLNESGKIRESQFLPSNQNAADRWSGGLTRHDSDVLRQNIGPFGAQSFFEREARANNAQYFFGSPLAMANVVVMPIAVIKDWSPFTGVNLVFWFLGTFFNQVLTVHGLGALMRLSGMSWFGGLIGTLLATGIAFHALPIAAWSFAIAAGTLALAAILGFFTGLSTVGFGRWLEHRLTDPITFAPVEGIHAGAQLGELAQSDPRFSTSGGGGDNRSTTGVRKEHLLPGRDEYRRTFPNSYFWVQVMFMWALFPLLRSIFYGLDITNVGMFWFSLALIGGGNIAFFTQNAYPGQNNIKGKTITLFWSLVGSGAALYGLNLLKDHLLNPAVAPHLLILAPMALVSIALISRFFSGRITTKDRLLWAALLGKAASYLPVAAAAPHSSVLSSYPLAFLHWGFLTSITPGMLYWAAGLVVLYALVRLFIDETNKKRSAEKKPELINPKFKNRPEQFGAWKILQYGASHVNRTIWRTIALFIWLPLVQIPDWILFTRGPYQSMPIAFLSAMFILSVVAAILLMTIGLGRIVGFIKAKELDRRYFRWLPQHLDRFDPARWPRRSPEDPNNEMVPQELNEMTRELSTSVNRFLVRRQEYANAEEAMNELDGRSSYSWTKVLAKVGALVAVLNYFWNSIPWQIRSELADTRRAETYWLAIFLFGILLIVSDVAHLIYEYYRERNRRSDGWPREEIRVLEAKLNSSQATPENIEAWRNEFAELTRNVKTAGINRDPRIRSAYNRLEKELNRLQPPAPTSGTGAAPAFGITLAAVLAWATHMPTWMGDVLLIAGSTLMLVFLRQQWMALSTASPGIRELHSRERRAAA